MMENHICTSLSVWASCGQVVGICSGMLVWQRRTAFWCMRSARCGQVVGICSEVVLPKQGQVRASCTPFGSYNNNRGSGG